MVAYTKKQVGNNLFTIEWDLVAGGSEVEGDKFEAVDCELVSMQGVTSGGLDCRLYLSNFDDPDSFRTSLLVIDSFLSPLPDSFGNPPLPPAVRWLWPILPAGSGVSHIALLFQEV